MSAILKRLALALPVVWLVVSLVFLLIHLVPGDPVDLMLGEGATPANKAALRHELEYDRPLPVQYIHYWKGVLHGDLGRSIKYQLPVGKMILERYPYTLALTLASLALALLLSLPAGILSAMHRGRWPDRLLGITSLTGLSIPGLALGPALIVIFSISLGWLPVSGASNIPSAQFSLTAIELPYLILPAITMGLSLAAILTRMVRTSMLEELNQDYIRTARAKGLSESAVILRHALPNALVPILTVVGLQFGALLAGAIVTETIFSWPGLGRLVVTAISSRDYELVQGCLLAIGLTYVVVNVLTDAATKWANPRMRV